MRPGKWLIILILLSAGIWMLQFFLFRQPAIFSSNLKTCLYDNGWWVRRPAKIVMVGGSNAMNSIIANDVARMNNMQAGDVVNLGMNQATPFEAHVSLQKYRARFGPPQAVYYTMTARFFYQGYQVEKDYERIFLSLAQWRELACAGISNNYFFPFNIWLNSLHFQPRHKLSQFQLSTEKTIQNNGYQVQYHHDFDKENLRPVFFPHPRRDLFPVSAFQVQHFKAMAEECQRDGIPFFVVLTPVYATLYQNEHQHPERYADLLQTLNAGMPGYRVVGSMNPAAYQLSYEHFINQDHLSDTGAQIYTRMVFADLRQQAALSPAPLRLLFTY